MSPRRLLLFAVLLPGLLAPLPFPVSAVAADVELAANGRPQVEIFTTSWCPYCKKAVRFFEEQGLEVVEYDIEKNRKAAQIKDRLDRRPGVPYVLIGRRIGIHGYAPEAYAKALEKLESGQAL